MSIKFANDCHTTLTSSVSSSATTISVLSVDSFPTLASGDFMYVNLTNLSLTSTEIVKVTAISGTTLTIERGQDGTTAAGFAAGDTVEARLTAGILDYLRTNSTSTAGTANVGSSNPTWVVYSFESRYVSETPVTNGKRLHYVYKGDDIYRFLPDPTYVATDDAYYSDTALTQLLARRN